MGRTNRPGNCRRCGTPPPIGLTVSWRGLCIDCAVAAMETNNRQLHEHQGPYFDHWRERCQAAFGAMFADMTTQTGR